MASFLFAGCGGESRKDREARAFLEFEGKQLAEFSGRYSAKTGWWCTVEGSLMTPMMLKVDKQSAILSASNSPVVLLIHDCDVETRGTNLILRSEVLPFVGLDSWHCDFTISADHLKSIRETPLARFKVWWVAARVTDVSRQTANGTNSMTLNGEVLGLVQHPEPTR